ncbi:uncharacterized, partial [Tachysurus ichikawai]
ILAISSYRPAPDGTRGKRSKNVPPAAVPGPPYRVSLLLGSRDDETELILDLQRGCFSHHNSPYFGPRSQMTAKNPRQKDRESEFSTYAHTGLALSRLPGLQSCLTAPEILFLSISAAQRDLARAFNRTKKCYYVK